MEPRHPKEIRIYLRSGNVVKLMCKLNWTEPMLARKLGVHYTMVFKIMQGDSPVSADLRTRIQLVFNGRTLLPHKRLAWDDLFKFESDTTGAAV